jgi:hypothetical protein
MPDMLLDMFDVAGEWEQSVPEHQRYGRRPLLVVLGLAGPRIIEVLQVERGGYGLGTGEMRGGRKTAAGRDRLFELSAFVTAEMDAHYASVRPHLLKRFGARLPLFHSIHGRPPNASTVRNRLLTEVVERANERRAAQGKLLLPSEVTPHMLRRAFASLCFFAGRDLKWTMGQLGHEDARMSAAVYAQGAQRRRIDYELVWQLMRFDEEPEHWADRHVPRAAFGPRIDPTAGRRTSTNRRMSDGRGWFRTTDLSRVKRLGVRAVEGPDRPSSRAILAFAASTRGAGDAVGSGRIRLDPGSTAQRPRPCRLPSQYGPGIRGCMGRREGGRRSRRDDSAPLPLLRGTCRRRVHSHVLGPGLLPLRQGWSAAHG